MKQQNSFKEEMDYHLRFCQSSYMCQPKPSLQSNSRGITVAPELYPSPGDFFPAKIAITFGMAQLLCGILLATFGSVAIMMEAAMADIGAGLWTGTIVIASGVLAIVAGKRPNCTFYLVGYMTLAILSLAVSGLLVVFSSMGLVKDQNHPYGYYVDNQGNKIEFLGEVPLKTTSIAMNTVLVILGILSVLLALASTVICGREACQCYYFGLDLSNDDLTLADSIVRRKRIINWLGQQDLNNQLASLSSHMNEKVYPTAVSIIPKVCQHPHSNSSNADKNAKVAVSPTTSCNTMKSELDNELISGGIIDRHLLLFGRNFSQGPLSIPRPGYLTVG